MDCGSIVSTKLLGCEFLGRFSPIAVIWLPVTKVLQAIKADNSKHSNLIMPGAHVVLFVS